MVGASSQLTLWAQTVENQSSMEVPTFPGQIRDANAANGDVTNLYLSPLKGVSMTPANVCRRLIGGKGCRPSSLAPAVTVQSFRGLITAVFKICSFN